MTLNKAVLAAQAVPEVLGWTASSSRQQLLLQIASKRRSWKIHSVHKSLPVEILDYIVFDVDGHLDSWGQTFFHIFKCAKILQFIFKSFFKIYFSFYNIITFLFPLSSLQIIQNGLSHYPSNSWPLLLFIVIAYIYVSAWVCVYVLMNRKVIWFFFDAK